MKAKIATNSLRRSRKRCNDTASSQHHITTAHSPRFEYKRTDGVWAQNHPQRSSHNASARTSTPCAVWSHVPNKGGGRSGMRPKTAIVNTADDMQRTGLATAGRRLRHQLQNAPKETKQPRSTQQSAQQSTPTSLTLRRDGRRSCIRSPIGASTTRACCHRSHQRSHTSH